MNTRREKIVVPLLVLMSAVVIGGACAGAKVSTKKKDLNEDKGFNAQIVQTAEISMSPIRALEWDLPKYAKIEGDWLIVDVPESEYGAEAVARAKLPNDLFKGAEGFSISITARGKAIAKPKLGWLGLKFQMHWIEKATGREGWPNCAGERGDFTTKTLVNDVAFGAKPDTIVLELGMQGTSGHVEFDLSTLCGAPSKGLFNLINQDYIIQYPEEIANRKKPLRGCMLPSKKTTEDDIETLHKWGATLARYQIVRNWSGRDDNQDLNEYAEWVDSRLDNIEEVLRWADARGMKIVIDVHVPPGGKRAKDGEMAMFNDDHFAEAWLDTWRRIATRFKGNRAIYGYDLINEPHQKSRAKNDYWTLQRRAAEIVREIDPDTPIIIESNGSDAASAFAYLSPLRMDNVIYQVHVYGPMQFTHQGVHGAPKNIVWPDASKKWDKEFIRATLKPVREFEKKHNAKIYVGEFSAAAWAPGAEKYLRDCIDLFEEYGWDWTYHAFREAKVWDVEQTGSDWDAMTKDTDTPRKRVLLEGFARP